VLNCSGKIKGFSLLELIIAIAILSIGIVTVLEALSFSARAAGLACDTIKASFLVEDKIQELGFQENRKLIVSLPPETGAEEGKFRWKYTLTPDTLLSIPDVTLYKLDFDIGWQKAAKKRNLSLVAYLRYEKE